MLYRREPRGPWRGRRRPSHDGCGSGRGDLGAGGAAVPEPRGADDSRRLRRGAMLLLGVVLVLQYVGANANRTYTRKGWRRESVGGGMAPGIPTLAARGATVAGREGPPDASVSGARGIGLHPLGLWLLANMRLHTWDTNAIGVATGDADIRLSSS